MNIVFHTHSDEHAAVLPHASQHSQVTHTGDDGTGDHQSVGGVDGQEGSDEGGELGVYQLELSERHHKRSAQLQHTQERQKTPHVIILDMQVYVLTTRQPLLVNFC